MNLPIPSDTKNGDVRGFFIDLVRRAVDGTIRPLEVDYTNGRVLIRGLDTRVLEVQNADGDVIFRVDTTNRRIQLRANDGVLVSIQAVTAPGGAYTLDIFA